MAWSPKVKSVVYQYTWGLGYVACIIAPSASSSKSAMNVVYSELSVLTKTATCVVLDGYALGFQSY